MSKKRTDYSSGSNAALFQQHSFRTSAVSKTTDLQPLAEHERAVSGVHFPESIGPTFNIENLQLNP